MLDRAEFDSFNYRSYKRALLLLIESNITLVLLLLASLGLGYGVRAQQAVTIEQRKI
jgi:hypothetical protein